MGYYITSEDDFSHTLIGGAAQNITLNSKITLEQYTRILFLNYPGSNDGALLAIAPGNKIITAFRNNGVWEEKSSHFLATKSDLACGRITVPANTEYLEVSFGKKIDNPSIVVTNIFSHAKNINGSISYVTSDGFQIYPYDTMQNGVPNVQTDFFWIAMSQG